MQFQNKCYTENNRRMHELQRQVFLLVFVDNVYFLHNSLDILVKSLGKNDLYYLSEEFNDNVFDLLKKKGLFPQDYCDSFEKFEEDLPTEGEFQNTFTNCEIGDKNYEHII